MSHLRFYLADSLTELLEMASSGVLELSGQGAYIFVSRSLVELKTMYDNYDSHNSHHTIVNVP